MAKVTFDDVVNDREVNGGCRIMNSEKEIIRKT